MDAYFILWTVLALWGSAHVLWGLYVIAMGLQRVHKTTGLSKAQWVFGLPYVILGYIIDFFFNVIFGTIVFYDIPRHGTFSARLTDYIENEKPGSYRYKLSIWVTTKLLDSIDMRGLHRA